MVRRFVSIVLFIVLSNKVAALLYLFSIKSATFNMNHG